jgi:predicted metalloprotease
LNAAPPPPAHVWSSTTIRTASIRVPPTEDPDRDLKDFSTYVFTDTQETWSTTFRRDGQPYENAQMVFYSGGVNTACGGASSAVGPFYCPGDQRIYLDLSFYRQMQQQLGQAATSPGPTSSRTRWGTTSSS